MSFLLSLFLLIFLHLATVLAAPKVLICSDSTTANYTSGALQGWGYHLHSYLTIPVINLAKNGASTRSFISDGLWSNLLSQTRPGDYIILEMGHNDESDPAGKPQYADRGTLPGLGDESKMVARSNGKQEKVYTFGHYLRQLIADAKAKGAVPIVSGMVPRNYWKGEKLQAEWPFSVYAMQQAKASGVEWVDHTRFSVRRLQALGSAGAKALFPNDNTHTNDKGARLNAETFVEAVRCGKSVLGQYLKDGGKEGSC